ncbi:MAG TPA: hypothetical protein VMV51_03585, partial [Gemmatimonadaceae bacterium]|nr:hypothetical protein [Gemmatimonadaceae bacterium]
FNAFFLSSCIVEAAMAGVSFGEREPLATRANPNPSGTRTVTPNKIRNPVEESRDMSHLERILHMPHPHPAPLHQDANHIEPVRLVGAAMT